MRSNSSNSTDRARKALNAMKELGFSRKQATPVLKQLLNTFNGNWEPIEDECYRALADAVCEALCNEQTSASPQGTQVDKQDPEPHATTSDRYASASHYDTGEDDDETPLVKRPRMAAAYIGQELQPFDNSFVPGPQQQSTVSTHPLPQTSWRQTRSLTQGQKTAHHVDPPAIVDALVLKEPKPEPQIGIAQVGVGDTLTCQDVLAGTDAIPLDIGSTGAGARGSIVNSSLQTVPMCSNRLGSTVQNTQEASFVEVDVASSTNGEVKMSLKCDLNPSKFRISMEEVFKMVAKKCLHSYKVLPPGFSIGKLMSEVCQSVVQLGTMHSGAHSNGGSLHKDTVAPFVKPIACEAAVGKDAVAPFAKPIACEAAVGTDDNAAGGSSVLGSTGACLQNSIVAWDPELVQCNRRTTHDVTDISKGEERIRMSVVNEFGSETCPPSFYYIPRNLVFQNASVNISIARIGDEDCCADCSGNCLSASLPCACARATGGEFAYTPEGLVKIAFIDECTSVNNFPEKHHRIYCKACPLERSKNEASPGPCKGHLARKFIKECWSKCGCGMQCGNRVIQRGITCKLQVFFTMEGKGWGLRTLEDLPKGAFVCEYAGEVLTSAELYERAVDSARNGKHMHQVLLDANWGSEGVLRDEEALGLDGTFYGNVGRFINHRCYDANLVQIPVEVETPDNHYYHVALFTNKKVEAFEELTWDYGIDFEDVEEGPTKVFRCMCGSRYCRDPSNPRRTSRAAARKS